MFRSKLIKLISAKETIISKNIKSNKVSKKNFAAFFFDAD